MITFHQLLKYEPYGVEYTPKGAEINKANFSLYGLNPDNVICTDFFSESFLRKYKSSFDVVMSAGFIEHFSEIETVLEGHLKLLKKGGICIISIPNLKGVNLSIAKFFNPERIKLHNLKIMNKETIKQAMENIGTATLLTEYYGTFDFGLFSAPIGLKRYLLYVLHTIQGGVNLVFRIVFSENNIEHRILSPHILYIGRKK